MELTLNLTHACNLACTYCFAGEKSERRMSLDTGRKGIDLALAEAHDGRLDVAFFGGEPLLEWDSLLALADDAIARARAQGVECRLSVTSNGTLLTEEKARALAERRFHLALSIDGTAASQDATRPFAGTGASSAKRVEKALEVALRHFPRPTVISVVDPLNVRWLAAGVRWLVDKGVRRVSLNPNWLGRWSDAALETWRQQYEEIALLWKARFRAGAPFSVSTIDYKVWLKLKGGTGTRDRCGYGKRELAVAPSGRLYPCGRVVGEDPEDAADPHRLHCLGDVDGGIDRAAQEAIPALGVDVPSECASCALRSRCSNWCGCTNVEQTGTPGEPGGLLCWHERMSIPIADRAASELYAERDPAFMRRFYFEDPVFAPACGMPEPEDRP